MSYILVLCLTGSVMEILYFSLKYVLGEKMPASWQYRMMKGMVLFYLVPLPFLKWFYKAVLGYFKKPPIEGMIHLYSDKSLVVYYGGRLIFNRTFEEQCRILGIWLLVAVCILVWQYVRYLHNDIRLNKYGKIFVDEADADQLARLKQQYGIKRKVRYMGRSGECSIGEAVFTTGIIHPTIVCFSQMQGRGRGMALEHEMVHIKRWDILWRVLLTAAQIIHWYNPFVWLLPGEFERVCEMSCDDQVIQGKEESEKREYCEMLLVVAMGEKQGRPYSLGLNKGGKRLKERIDNVMIEKKKCFGKVVSACIFGVAIFLNSLTVFAYEDVQFTEVKKGDERHLENVLNYDIAFVPGGEEEIKKYPLYENTIIDVNIVYEMQFVDAEGNVYPVYADEVSLYASCNHNYVAGTYQEHIKYSDGSCTVIQYSAERCTKCSETKIGEEKQRISFKPCPH